MQVRGHLAASIDPLGLNNMDREEARKMIIRSVTVDEKVIDQSNFVDNSTTKHILRVAQEFSKQVKCEIVL